MNLAQLRKDLQEARDRLMKARQEAGEDMNLDAVTAYEGDAQAKAKAISADSQTVEELTDKIKDLVGAEEALKIANGFDTDPQPPAGTKAKTKGGSLGATVIGDEDVAAYLKGITRGNRVPDGTRINAPSVTLEKAFKDIISGSDATGGGAFREVDYTGIYEPLGRRDLLLRDVIATRTTDSDMVSFVRAVSRTINAAMTEEASGDPNAPAGGTKPFGSWDWEEVTQTVRTVAELAAATRQTLADAPALQGLVDQELRDNLAQTVEDQIIAGDGVGQNLTGLLNVSGTLAEALSADDPEQLREFFAIRRAKRRLRVDGRVRANGLGLNPEDEERLDLRLDNQNRLYGNGPFGVGPEQIWGMPKVVTEAIPQGTAILADWSKGVLWDREQVTIDMTDSHADFFARNLVAVRAEARLAFGVIRPQAFTIIDLTPVA